MIHKKAYTISLTVSLINVKNWKSTCKRIKLSPYLTQNTKISSKWIHNLHVRCKTIKLFKENVGKTS